MTIDAIKPSDILTAIRFDDLDKALSYLQIIAGIDSGDVAGQVFAGFDWRSADYPKRVEKLKIWLAAERTYSGDKACAFNVEHYHALDFLLRSLEDLGFSQHLPRVMEGAREAMTALRADYPMAAQYAQKQRAG
jgi:hypothetical protein